MTPETQSREIQWPRAEPSEQRNPPTPGHPYRGPDRRGVARFVIPARPPTIALAVAAVAWILVAPHVSVHLSATALVELDAVASTLALIGGVGCILRWRLDGIARGWWCGWALLAIGTGQLVLEPVRGPGAIGVELAMFIIGTVLFGCAIFGPEVDATIRPLTTIGVVAAGVAVSVIPALAVGGSEARATDCVRDHRRDVVARRPRRGDPVAPRLPRRRSRLDHPGRGRARPRRARAGRGRRREQRARRGPMVRARGDGDGRGRRHRRARPRRGPPPHPRASGADRVRT